MPRMSETPDPGQSFLLETCHGRSESPEELFGRLYKELRQVAHGYMRRERADHTLQATALVNEAYLRLFNGQPFQWENRKHFFCTVARSMRRVLMDHARKRDAGRHGGALQKVELDEQGPAIFYDLASFMALSEMLDRLAQLSPRKAQVVELHSFAGLTEEETAEVLEVSVKTVKNDWRFVKAWLKAELLKN